MHPVFVLLYYLGLSDIMFGLEFSRAYIDDLLVQYADFQEEENKAERYCWEDIAATLRI